MASLFFVALAVVVIAAFFIGRQRATMVAGGERGVLHSLPSYHGAWLALTAGLPMLLLAMVWSPIAPRIINDQALSALPADLQPTDDLSTGARLREIYNAAAGQVSGEVSAGIRAAADTLSTGWAISGWGLLIVGLGLAAAGFFYGYGRIGREFRARNWVERATTAALVISSLIAILTTVGIVLSVFFETMRFFTYVSPIEFLFGTQWSPQLAMRADQVGSSGAFGIIPLLVGTLLIMGIAMLVAGPVGLFSAIYLAEYASPRFRAFAKPVLEILAGIPTVVYGFFAALTMAPFVREMARAIGLDATSESALAAGVVMGVMILPFISSLSDDVINAVPQSLRDGSYGMGATRSETIKRVVLPAALPGIVAAMMLAVSKGVGETMIVVMAAGMAANLTLNPLDSVTTITVQIATLLTGDQEFDSPKTLAAFALGFVLFIFTLILNLIALRVVKKYREQYD
jgi:phosphate transport system permease protein